MRFRQASEKSASQATICSHGIRSQSGARWGQTEKVSLRRSLPRKEGCSSGRLRTRRRKESGLSQTSESSEPSHPRPGRRNTATNPPAKRPGAQRSRCELTGFCLQNKTPHHPPQKKKKSLEYCFRNSLLPFPSSSPKKPGGERPPRTVGQLKGVLEKARSPLWSPRSRRARSGVNILALGGRSWGSPSLGPSPLPGSAAGGAWGGGRGPPARSSAWFCPAAV